MGDFLTFKSLPSFPRAAAEPGQAGISSCFLDSHSLSTRVSISDAELTLSINSDSNHLSPLKMTEETQQGGFLVEAHSHVATKADCSVIVNPARAQGALELMGARKLGWDPEELVKPHTEGSFLGMHSGR